MVGGVHVRAYVLGCCGVLWYDAGVCACNGVWCAPIITYHHPTYHHHHTPPYHPPHHPPTRQGIHDAMFIKSDTLLKRQAMVVMWVLQRVQQKPYTIPNITPVQKRIIEVCCFFVVLLWCMCCCGACATTVVVVYFLLHTHTHPPTHPPTNTHPQLRDQLSENELAMFISVLAENMSLPGFSLPPEEKEALAYSVLTQLPLMSPRSLTAVMFAFSKMGWPSQLDYDHHWHLVCGCLWV